MKVFIPPERTCWLAFEPVEPGSVTLYVLPADHALSWAVVKPQCCPPAAPGRRSRRLSDSRGNPRIRAAAVHLEIVPIGDRVLAARVAGTNCVERAGRISCADIEADRPLDDLQLAAGQIDRAGAQRTTTSGLVGNNHVAAGDRGCPGQLFWHWRARPTSSCSAC